MNARYTNARDAQGQPLEFAVENGRFTEPAGQPVVDLHGATVLPGFVDAHCHVVPMGLDLLKLHLGPCESHDDVLAALGEHHRSEPDGWLMAVHYDQTKFDGSVHMSRDQLDRVVPDRPVLLRHSNGHASVANSAALQAAGIDDSTPDPTGGTFVRDASGRLTGVLLERAHERVTSASPPPTLDEMTAAVLRAGEKMAALGITCASDMMTGRWDLDLELQAYTRASQQGCKVRLRLYAQWATVLGPRRIDPERLVDLQKAADPELCRLAGVKIFADGAIGSATAAIYGTFLTTGGNGQLIYEPERFKSMVAQADAAGWQVAVHTIGDRSTDLVMDAYEATADPTRHRIEHAMVLSDAQIERLARLGSYVTMQPEFMLRFGHAYKKQLGPERAARIKRCRSVLDAGIRLSFSSDRPIVPGDPWDGVMSAVDRPEGFGTGEAVTLDEALRLYTQESAKPNGDEGRMGVVAPGAHADFQTYDRLGQRGLKSVFLAGAQTH